MCLKIQAEVVQLHTTGYQGINKQVSNTCKVIKSRAAEMSREDGSVYGVVTWQIHLDSAQVHCIIAASVRDVEAARDALHLIAMPPQWPAVALHCWHALHH